MWKNRFSLYSKAPLHIWILTSWLRAWGDNWSKLSPSSPEFAVNECLKMPGWCEWAAEIPHSQILLALSLSFSTVLLASPNRHANLKNNENKVCGCLSWTRAVQTSWLASSTGFETSYSISAHLVMNHSETAGWSCSWAVTLQWGHVLGQWHVCAQGMLQDCILIIFPVEYGPIEWSFQSCVKQRVF